MHHFALIAPPTFSHLRAMEALAEALVARGHRATFVHMAGVKARLGETAAGFAPIAGGGEAVLGRMDAALSATGPLATLRLVGALAATSAAICRGAPAVLRDIEASAVIGDQAEPAAGLVAAALGLPHVSIAAALLLDRDPAVPPPFLGWRYDPAARGEKRNRGAWRVSDMIMAPQRRALAGAARRLGLPPDAVGGGAGGRLPPLAEIVQGTAAFDFPRRALPPYVHYIGRLRREDGGERRGSPDGPFDQPGRGGRPVVFASLGTLFGGRLDLFRTIAAACRAHGATLLAAHCGRLTAAEAASIGADRATDFAPMPEAMAAADVVVTHAGMNTTLDALAAGRPILALPIAFDQPGIAARIAHCGAGLKLNPRRLTARDTAAALGRLLAEPSFRAGASRLGQGIAAAGGVARAADIIEAAVARAEAASDAPAGSPQRLRSFAA